MAYRVGRRNRRYRVLLFASAALVVGVLIAVVVVRQRAAQQGEAEMRAVRSKLSKLVLLPDAETPTLATVQDTHQLTDPYLKKIAQNGDKILLYPVAKKAYVYRPGINRLVDITPVGVAASAAEVRGARIVIWRGGASEASAAALQKKIEQTYQSAASVTLANSKRQDYPETVVVDLTNSEKYNFVTELMQAIGAQRGIVPQGDAAPENADVLIIIGADKS